MLLFPTDGKPLKNHPYPSCAHIYLRQVQDKSATYVLQALSDKKSIGLPLRQPFPSPKLCFTEQKGFGIPLQFTHFRGKRKPEAC